MPGVGRHPGPVGESMNSVLGRYRELPRLAGGEFLPIAFLARLPGPMTQIGTVLLVSTTSGSIALAGLAAGALGIGTALGGPVIGLLTDHHGQRTLIAPVATLNAVLTCALVIGVLRGLGGPLVMLIAFAVGLSSLPIGPLVRSRWISLTASDSAPSATPNATLSAAMSYEGAADEIAYIFGPALVSLLAAVASPAAAVLTSALLVGVFGTWVGLHRTSPSKGGLAFEADDAVAVWHNPVIVTLILIAMTIGSFFGGLQTGVTELANHAGLPASAGLVYSAMALGSAVAALATAALPARFTVFNRLALFAAAMAVLTVPLIWIQSLTGVAAALLLLGAAVGPTLVTIYTAAQGQVSAARTGTTMTLLSSGLAVGYLIGSSSGGRLAQQHGGSAAFVVSMAAVTVGAVLAAGLRFARRSTG